MQKSHDILKQYWGFDQFRPLQEEIVDNLIYGHDTLAILSTGGGKSICFQVPGIARDGICLVISPLIALMQDQVQNLQKRGIKAELITGSMTYREIDIALDNARFGNTKFLYTSPERLKSSLFIERFKLMNVSMITIDEAHCISEWGHDFRPSYREIANLRQYHPEAPMIALTASATLEVQDDIVKSLGLRDVKIIKGSVERSNIAYRVLASENKQKNILDYCKEHDAECGIIYCQTRRSVKTITKYLRAHSISVGMYHGGMKRSDRDQMLSYWMDGTIQVMIATNAFGMGIDKPNVRFVLHFEIPDNLEAYYQEAGRAGRDGKDSVAIAFWERKDLEIQENHLSQKYPEKDRIRVIYNAICNFLGIAIGSGEGETFAFDISRFSHEFKIGIMETYHALKILSRNGNMELTDGQFLPTRLQLLIGSSALYKFQVAHDSLSGLITLLTRSYPGVFDRFISINENELAKRLDINKQELRRQLEVLEQYGVIDVHFQSNSQQITMIQERLPESHISFRPEVYENRKRTDTQKLQAITDYITSSNCRAELIAAYFGSPTQKCGKCDVCREQMNSPYTHDELIESIPELLPATIGQLEDQMKVLKTDIQKALHNLILEEKVVFEDRVYRLTSSQKT